LELALRPRGREGAKMGKLYQNEGYFASPLALKYQWLRLDFPAAGDGFRK
jgi:hypothetical protein